MIMHFTSHLAGTLQGISTVSTDKTATVLQICKDTTKSYSTKSTETLFQSQIVSGHEMDRLVKPKLEQARRDGPRNTGVFELYYAKIDMK